MIYDKIINRLKLVFPSFRVFTDYDADFDVFDSLTNTQTRGIRIDDTKGNYFFIYKGTEGYTDSGIATYNISVLMFMESKCKPQTFDTTLKCLLGALSSGCGASNVSFTTNKRSIIDRETAGFGGIDIDRLNWVLGRFWLLRVDFKISESLPLGNCECLNCDC